MLNGKKTYIGLVVAGLGALSELFNCPYAQEIITGGLAWAGLGASHKLYKGH